MVQRAGRHQAEPSPWTGRQPGVARHAGPGIPHEPHRAGGQLGPIQKDQTRAEVVERGLAALGQLLAHADADMRLSLSVLESRLLDNLKGERLYGSTETIRAERARIVGELNRLALR